MADAKKCDRCGGFYEETKRSFRVRGTIASRVRILGTNGGFIGDYDLCDKCAEEFFQFLCCEESEG